MVPGRAVVPGPGGGIALTAGVGGAGHHERTHTRAQPQHSVEGPTRVLHSVDVVDLGMRCVARREIIAYDPIDVSERARLGRGFEHRRLVHIVPSLSNGI